LCEYGLGPAQPSPAQISPALSPAQRPAQPLPSSDKLSSAQFSPVQPSPDSPAQPSPAHSQPSPAPARPGSPTHPQPSQLGPAHPSPARPSSKPSSQRSAQPQRPAPVPSSATKESPAQLAAHLDTRSGVQCGKRFAIESFLVNVAGPGSKNCRGSRASTAASKVGSRPSALVSTRNTEKWC
jgi:hypothetical protein